MLFQNYQIKCQNVTGPTEGSHQFCHKTKSTFIEKVEFTLSRWNSSDDPNKLGKRKFYADETQHIQHECIPQSQAQEHEVHFNRTTLCMVKRVES